MKKLIIIFLLIFAISCKPSYPQYEEIYYYWYRGAWHPYHFYTDHRYYHKDFHVGGRK